MTAIASPSESGAAFDNFLYAPVDATLTVLSALARLNLDPWKEAAALARLPASAAEARLASLIATLPDAALDSQAIATRLIALLPRFPGLAGPMEAARSRFTVAARYPQLAIYALLGLIIAVVALRYFG
jgi:hypothetical protein